MESLSVGGNCRPVASRICCWWTQYSVKSRAQSNHTGAGSGLTHDTGSPVASRSACPQKATTCGEVACSMSISSCGLSRAAARTHSSLSR